MKWYELKHLGARDLLEGAARHHRGEHEHKGRLLAHLAEIDAQRLYLPAAYPSVHAWCTGALGMSPDAAYKNIQAARTAQRFPLLFEAVLDGRLSPSAICDLGPHLTPENVGELVTAAARKSVTAVREMLERRFATPLLVASAAPANPVGATAQIMAAHCENREQLATSRVEVFAMPVAIAAPQGSRNPEAMPHAHSSAPAHSPLPHRTRIEIWLDDEAMADLQAALELDGHNVGPREHSKLFARALKAYRQLLAKRRCAETEKPRQSHRASKGPRAVPAAVRRDVWRRDEGRCTFTSDAGHRCEARSCLQLDHIKAFACGGESTVENLRLRCRAHNQFTAEQQFGRGFMEEKRASGRARPGTASQRPRAACTDGAAAGCAQALQERA